MPKLIVISGPTASGKTKLSISLALKLACPIISADSRQIYKELGVGVAKPSPDQLLKVEHHLIGMVSIHEKFDTATYVAQVVDLLDDLFKTHQHVILVGGTGLYIDGVLYGIDDMPSNDPKISEDLQASYELNGITSLQTELAIKDPVYFAEVDKSNHVRLMRALNVIRQTDRPFSDFRKKSKIARPFEFLHFNIDIQRVLLYSRIDLRVDEMIENGLEEEVRNLMEFKHLQALQTVGYSEWWPYFDGLISKEEVIEKIKQHTRNYAKRQVTWFKKRKTIDVPFSQNSSQMTKHILKYLNN